VTQPLVPPERHIRVVPKPTFVARVDRVCRDLDTVDIGGAPAVDGAAYRNRRALGPWFDHAHAVVRRVRQRFYTLGHPATDNMRWERVLSKIRAEESHLDTVRAAAWSGSATMFMLSLSELKQTDVSLGRRLRRFGVTRCAQQRA